jgi:hypothetical protein
MRLRRQECQLIIVPATKSQGISRAQAQVDTAAGLSLRDIIRQAAVVCMSVCEVLAVQPTESYRIKHKQSERSKNYI